MNFDNVMAEQFERVFYGADRDTEKGSRANSGNGCDTKREGVDRVSSRVRAATPF